MEDVDIVGGNGNEDGEENDLDLVDYNDSQGSVKNFVNNIKKI